MAYFRSITPVYLPVCESYPKDPTESILFPRSRPVISEMVTMGLCGGAYVPRIDAFV